MLDTIHKFTAIALLVVSGIAAAPVNAAQGGRDYREAQARREREIQACMRPAEVAFQKALSEAQRNLKEAEREAQQAYSAAIHKDKSDAARTAARKAKQEALRKAQGEAESARRAAQEARQEAEQDCRTLSGSR